MRRERCNRGRDGVPEHIMTSVNNRGRGGGSLAAARGETRGGSVEELRGRVTEGEGKVARETGRDTRLTENTEKS